MDSSDQNPKRSWLPEILAAVLAVLVVVWGIREHAWGASAIVIGVGVLAILRNRKSGFGSPVGDSKLATAVVAALFAGPIFIVLVGIFRPEIALATAACVIVIYAAVATVGRRLRFRGSR